MVVRLTCLASAMVALSAGTTAAAQTPAAPPANPPAASPDSDQVLLRADLITDDVKNLITTAEGNVEVRVGQRMLRADRLVYDQNKQTMRAQGNVQIVDETGGVQFADEIEADEDFRNGFATRFSTRLGGNAIATASSAIRTDGTRNALEQVVYTGCPICEENGNEPTWSLRARRAVQNTETQMITYQDAVLEIKGVPVLYLPYFAHPDPTSERRSGFMVPDIGNDSRLGAFYEQPYYWAISPSQDMTIAPMFSSNVNPLIKVDYRKRFFSGFIAAESSFTHEREFDSDGGRSGADKWRGHIYGGGRFNINQDWQWGFGIERQTDDLYDQRYDIDGEDDLRGLFASQPRQLLSQVFTTGQKENFYFEGGAFLFQGLRAGDDDDKFPKVTPSIFAQKIFDFGRNGQLATDLSAVGLFRDARAVLADDDSDASTPPPQTLDTARVTASADWGSQYIVGPGLVVEPFASAREDFYHIDKGNTPGIPDPGARDVTRFLGVAGAQVSYPFIRRGDNVDIIIEPVAMVGYGTKGANNDDIPNEDSLVFEADESNLFKPNAVSNYDLWEGGSRAALGMSATARIGKDVEVSTLFGKRWHEDADPAFNQLSNLSGTESDYVASVKAEFGSALRTGARMRMDQDLKINRIDLDANVNWWRLSGSARYFRLDQNAAGAKDEGLLWRGEFKVTDRWSAIVAQQRNIELRENIGLSVGVGYRDECSFFLLSYERSGGRDRTLGPSEGIRFTFALTGLGGASSD
jgi:LPS-assembly protein